MTLPNILQRLRATASLALTWAVTWGAAAGVVGGAVTSVMLWTQGYPPPVGELVGAFALVGALSGAVSAVGFAIMVAGLGRRRTLVELPARKLGLLSGALALAIGGAFFGLGEPAFALTLGLFGFTAGAGTLALARRGALQAPSTSRAELSRG